jgi:hypothetical protein
VRIAVSRSVIHAEHINAAHTFAAHEETRSDERDEQSDNISAPKRLQKRGNNVEGDCSGRLTSLVA